MNHLCLSIQPGPALTATLARAMSHFGFKTYAASSWSAALRALSQWHFDVVLLEPDGVAGDRTETMARLRETRVPVLLTTPPAAAHELPSEWHGLPAGSAAPASELTLAARLHEIAEAGDLRGAGARAVLSLGPLRLDARSGHAICAGRSIEFTPCEFELLYLLVTHAGEFVSRDTMSTLLQHPAGSGRRSMDMHISRIRKKLREHGATQLLIRAVYKRGYCAALQADGFADSEAGIDAVLAAPGPRAARPASRAGAFARLLVSA